MYVKNFQKVVLADTDVEAGRFAVEKLCKAYGKDRARLYTCDVKNSAQIEGSAPISFLCIQMTFFMQLKHFVSFKEYLHRHTAETKP